MIAFKHTLALALALIANFLIFGGLGARAAPDLNIAARCGDVDRPRSCIIASDGIQVVGSGVLEVGTLPNAKGVTFYRVDPTGSEGEINGCNNSTILWSVDILTPLKKSQIDARYQPAEGKIAAFWARNSGAVASHGQLLTSTVEGDDIVAHCLK